MTSNKVICGDNEQFQDVQNCFYILYFLVINKNEKEVHRHVTRNLTLTIAL